jgi:hypothetical protein
MNCVCVLGIAVKSNGVVPDEEAEDCHDLIEVTVLAKQSSEKRSWLGNVHNLPYSKRAQR